MINFPFYLCIDSPSLELEPLETPNCLVHFCRYRVAAHRFTSPTPSRTFFIFLPHIEHLCSCKHTYGFRDHILNILPYVVKALREVLTIQEICCNIGLAIGPVVSFEGFGVF